MSQNLTAKQREPTGSQIYELKQIFDFSKEIFISFVVLSQLQIVLLLIKISLTSDQYKFQLKAMHPTTTEISYFMNFLVVHSNQSYLN